MSKAARLRKYVEKRKPSSTCTQTAEFLRPPGYINTGKKTWCRELNPGHRKSGATRLRKYEENVWCREPAHRPPNLCDRQATKIQRKTSNAENLHTSHRSFEAARPRKCEELACRGEASTQDHEMITTTRLENTRKTLAGQNQNPPARANVNGFWLS